MPTWRFWKKSVEIFLELKEKKNDKNDKNIIFIFEILVFRIIFAYEFH